MRRKTKQIDGVGYSDSIHTRPQSQGSGKYTLTGFIRYQSLLTHII